MNKQNIKGIQGSYLYHVDTTNLIAYLNLSCKQMQAIDAYFLSQPQILQLLTN